MAHPYNLCLLPRMCCPRFHLNLLSPVFLWQLYRLICILAVNSSKFDQQFLLGLQAAVFHCEMADTRVTTVDDIEEGTQEETPNPLEVIMRDLTQIRKENEQHTKRLDKVLRPNARKRLFKT